MRIAVIGSGIAGLSTAWLLSAKHDVTLFESEDRLGGHSHTVDVGTEGRSVPVDTGFIVYNAKNYPNLVALFDRLGVATEPSDMSFSASIGGGALEYAGSAAGITAQPANLLKPRYLGMLADLVRFYRTAGRVLETASAGDMTLGEWLQREGYGAGFVHDHLLPMGAAIWSCPVGTMLAFPVRSFVQFFVNHGLLEFVDRPEWRTVSGGSRSYVRRLAAPLLGRIRLATPVRSVRRRGGGVEIQTDGDASGFDSAVIAAHADQALAMLDAPDPEESRLLGAFSYQRNEVILHSDPALMPRRRRVWSSWNYLADAGDGPDRRVAVTYWMNRLQNLDPARPLFVSLNPLREPAPDRVHGRYSYQHPVFDTAAIGAQRQLDTIQGRNGVWYCGSYCGWGFHEDGLRAGIAVARGLGVEPPWASDVPAAGGRLASLDAAD